MLISQRYHVEPTQPCFDIRFTLKCVLNVYVSRATRFANVFTRTRATVGIEIDFSTRAYDNVNIEWSELKRLKIIKIVRTERVWSGGEKQDNLGTSKTVYFKLGTGRSTTRQNSD